MIDLGVYKDKFGESGLRIFQCAVDEAHERNQNYVSLGHIIRCLAAGEGVFNNFLNERRIMLLAKSEYGVLTETNLDKLIEGSPRHEGRGVRLAPGVVRLLKRAMQRAQEQGRKRIEATDFVSLLVPQPYARRS